MDMRASISKSRLPTKASRQASGIHIHPLPNTFGGTIILGIGEDRRTKKFLPLGVDNPQQIILDIWNTLDNRQNISCNILLEHHVYPCHYQGRIYVVMEIPRAERTEKPIFIGEDMFKGSFKRNHEGDYHCT